MDNMFVIFRLLAFSQALLLSLVILLHYRTRMGYLTALLCLCIASYMIVPATGVLYDIDLLQDLLSILATLTPSLIWLLGYWFFADGDRVPWWLILLTVFYLTLSMEFVPISFSDENLHSFVFSFVPQFIKLGLIFHMMYMAIVDDQLDLVPERQRLRRPLVVAIGVIAGIVMLVELWINKATPLFVENFGSVLLFLATLAGNVYLLRLQSDFLGHRLPQPDLPVVEDQSELIAQLEIVMGEQRYYANPGATINGLAETLSLAEHKLRRLINKELGYRNFNHYLNRYRIEEASRRLIAERDLPILTIALDVGFNSLSSFNKAFKEKHGQTPTEFRRIA